MVSLHYADEVLAADAEDEAGFFPPVVQGCGIFAVEVELWAL